MDNRRPVVGMDEDREKNGCDWQEETYKKIRAMKEMYYYELTKIHDKAAKRIHQAFVPPNVAVLAKASYQREGWGMSYFLFTKFESLPEQMKEELYKLESFKTMTECFLSFLELPKRGVTPGLKEELAMYEKNLIKFMNNRRHMEETDGGDWQEEVYQKIKAMKDLYLPQLSDLSKRVAAKLQCPRILPDVSTMSDVSYGIGGEMVPCHLVISLRSLQEETNQHREHYKKVKATVHRMISLLHLPKERVTADLEEKLGTLEKQIVDFINKIPPADQNYEDSTS